MNKQTSERQELRKPHRLWMTESFAVLMAALGPVANGGATQKTVRQSPYSVGETILRIEAEALNQGLSVLAELNGSQPVIVLGSSIGGTPVVMDRADSRPAIPLSVGVREAKDGALLRVEWARVPRHAWRGSKGRYTRRARDSRMMCPARWRSGGGVAAAIVREGEKEGAERGAWGRAPRRLAEASRG